MRRKKESRIEFSQYLESEAPLLLQRRGIDLYTIDGKIVVDKVCFFENLEKDLEDVRLRCGIPEKLTLLHIKGSYRKDSRTYQEFLNKDQADKIRKMSSREIELLGYEF